MSEERFLRYGLKANFDCDYSVNVYLTGAGQNVHVDIGYVQCVYYASMVTLTKYNSEDVICCLYTNKKLDYMLGDRHNYEEFLFNHYKQIKKLLKILPVAENIKTYILKFHKLIEETNYLSVQTFSLCALRTGICKDMRIKISKLMFENKKTIKTEKIEITDSNITL